MDTTKRHIYTIFTVTVVLAVVIAGTSAGALSAIGDSTAQTTSNMEEDVLKLVPPDDGEATAGGEEEYELVLTEVPSEGFTSIRVEANIVDGAVADFTGVSSGGTLILPPGGNITNNGDTVTFTASDTLPPGNIVAGDANVVLATITVEASSGATAGDTTEISLDLACQGAQVCSDDNGDDYFPPTQGSSLAIV